MATTLALFFVEGLDSIHGMNACEVTYFVFQVGW